MTTAWARAQLVAVGDRLISAERRASADLVTGERHLLKIHDGDPADRLACVRALPELFVQPEQVLSAPDGRTATLWPRLRVLDERDDIDWTAIGRLLADLHQSVPPGPLPSPTWPRRLADARTRASPGYLALVDQLLAAVGTTPDTAGVLLHGDFHLGQIAVVHGRPLLLDIDDLAVGAPAWDLARPAGFWAAGLLDDESWQHLLAGYRERRPLPEPLWESLDLPARVAVYVAAFSRHDAAGEQRRLLLQALDRMAAWTP